MIRVRSLLVALAPIFVALPARGEPSTLAAPPSTPAPWDGVGTDIVDAFTGWNLLYYGAAVAATGGMAFSGADHAVRLEFQRHLTAPAYGDVSNIAGYAVPLVTAPTIWIVGLASHDRDVVGAGSAAIQAAVITLATTGILKVGVGRAYPLNGGDPDAPDRLSHPEYAHAFEPFRNGIASWPSGHTSVTISIAAALTGYAPDAWWIPAVGYPLALAIGVGMIDRDSHWASDVVAGALIGHAIGFTIGRNFRARVRGERGASAPAGSLEVVPLAAARGVALAGTW